MAQGLADHLNLPVLVIRIAFLALTAVNGVGVIVYVLLWAVIPQDDADLRAASKQLRTGPSTGRPAASVHARQVLRDFGYHDENVRALVLGVALIAGAVIVVISRFSDTVQLSVAVPVSVVLAGAALGLGQLDRAERERWLMSVSFAGRWGALRVAAGLLLVVAGVVLLLAPRLGPGALLVLGVALLAVLAGVAIVLAPWGRRLLQDLERERGERVRQEERAEIAAHLHDSVLQTLALIQRRAHDAETVARLARAQERQLREYLYGAGEVATHDESLVAAVRRICGEVEDDHGTPIELVSVGDIDVTPGTQSLLQALREALLNAARHGKAGVSVYVECTGGAVEAFVRDRGAGFDLAAVPADRLGVRESVIGRMQRAGGSATVRAAPGGGTEVSLRLPVPAG